MANRALELLVGAPTGYDVPPELIRDLLEEIDRSLKSFEQAARLHSWLGDAGLGAEPAQVAAASAALGSGSRAGAVDLARFVADAVLIDGGALYGDVTDEVFELTLPPAWLHGLDDLPGYDPKARLFPVAVTLLVPERQMNL